MKVAIFGAGTMGRGIAQVFAANGHTALMYASSIASAQRHRDELDASLQKRVAKGKMPQGAKDALMANVFVEEESAAADADLVIECIAEEMGPKKELFHRLDELCKPETIFAIQHFLPVHHGDGPRPEASPHRHALLQPRAQHEAHRGHPGREHPPGDLRLHL